MTQPYPPPQGAPQFSSRPGPPAPEQPSLLPWLILAGGMLMAALVVLGVLLFTGKDNTDTAAAAARTTQQSDAGRGDTDGRAVMPPESAGPELPGDVIDDNGPIYEHTLDKAAAFMDDVILGDWPSAISHGSQEFQLHYGDDTDRFAAEIAQATNGGTLGDYSLDSATYDATVAADVVSITIIMEEGWPDDFTVLIGEEDGNLVVVGFR
jgi:hypothetical protein